MSSAVRFAASVWAAPVSYAILGFVFVAIGLFVARRRRDAYSNRETACGECMTDDEILAEFRASEALLDGHFILSSGLRSPRYLQCARVLMDPTRAERLASLGVP